MIFFKTRFLLSSTELHSTFNYWKGFICWKFTNRITSCTKRILHKLLDSVVGYCIYDKISTNFWFSYHFVRFILNDFSPIPFKVAMNKSNRSRINPFGAKTLVRKCQKFPHRRKRFLGLATKFDSFHLIRNKFSFSVFVTSTIV